MSKSLINFNSDVQLCENSEIELCENSEIELYENSEDDSEITEGELTFNGEVELCENSEPLFSQSLTSLFSQNSISLREVEHSEVDFSSTSGGCTCCVPNCFNNSKRNKNLSFYVIPKEKVLRKLWLAKISRKDFSPSSSHRVCSAHFQGNKKTYMNNVPTIIPKTVKLTARVPRKTKNSLGLIHKTIQIPYSEELSTPVLSYEETLKQENKILKDQIEDIIKEKQALENTQKEAICKLNDKILLSQFTVERFKHNKEHFKFYTGFENFELFKVVMKFLEPEIYSLNYWGSMSTVADDLSENSSSKTRGRSRILNVEEEFFMVLIRLRCAFPIEDLAIRFNISSSTTSRILITWYDFLHIKFRSIPIWPTKKLVNETMPSCFKDVYPNTRVIIDCTEIFTVMPTSYRIQSAMFSKYKHHHTAKGLIGIAPSGAITFVSDLYAGRSSDKQITNHCGILKLLEKGDSLMADRGFDIVNDLPKGISLNIPPFLEGDFQLTLEKELETRRIASVRIHVERAIARIKNYRILQNTFPLSMAADMNKIWVIVCYLVTFLPPLIKTDSK
ncbi:uncharacterized protein LOC136078877 [Hydra vulgaris]|uniref:Uncharacterized protein LOC136078877 n=1 Tax=Hydra vulgaris TaxID=6087 RepID=A0ABM4BNT8_HYDVU